METVSMCLRGQLAVVDMHEHNPRYTNYGVLKLFLHYQFHASELKD